MHRRSDIQKSTITCSPTMYQNTLHTFSAEQINFLNRGPCYVIPGQMHLSPFAFTSTAALKQFIQQQMAPLHRQLTAAWSKYPVDLSRRTKFQDELNILVHRSFIQPIIPASLKERVQYEQQLVQSIRSQFNAPQLPQEYILQRTADGQNTYYLGRRSEFKFQAAQHVKTSDCYELIGSIDDVNTEEKYLRTILTSIDETLENLFRGKFFTPEHLNKLKVYQRAHTIKLPQLYFLPEINTLDGTHQLQPRLSFSTAFYSPVQILATHLQQLLRPLFEQISQSITLINGGDFLRKLRSHCDRRQSFRSTTYLVTFEVENLHTHLPHENLLTGLQSLLHNSLVYQRHHQGILTDGIHELTSLFLRNQVFIFDGKVYRYRRGCSLIYPLSRLLFNIYLYHWQSTLFRPIRVIDEFYGLYHTKGFLTWNKSLEEITTMFNDINQSFEKSLSPIRLTSSMGLQVHFLHCSIENRKGYLFTRVYHDPAQQPFLLPYASQHPRLYHRQWFRFAHVRAGLYCTDVKDFYDEQLYIELTFLANGYSLEFVEGHIREFFRVTKLLQTEAKFTQHLYNISRNDLFRYQLGSQDRLIQQRDMEIKRQWIHFHYLYDWGLRWQFNEEFVKKWKEIIEKDPKFKSYRLKIQLHTKHCFSSNILLTR